MTIQEFSVIGISVRTTNENSQSSQDIQKLWEKFLSEKIIDTIPEKFDDTIYCIYTDYEKDYTRPYTTILGCKVKNIQNIPEGMIAKNISTGQYEKFVAKGNLMEGVVYNEWVKIWNSDLNRSYTADFEVYNSNSQNMENVEVEIFIAIQE